MKKYFFLLISFVCISFLLKGQDCGVKYLGSKTLYSALQQVYHNPPGNYTPVFINHVGRHGARHLTKDVASYQAYKLLIQADSTGQLTSEGKELLEKVMNLEKVEKKDFESISYEGQTEQYFIAQRMYENFKPLFEPSNLTFNVVVTKKIRTTQTSNAFLKYLLEVLMNPKIQRETNDTTLRFYDQSPVYAKFEEDGYWTQSLEKIKQETNFPELARTFAEKFFKAPFINKLKQNNLEKFTSDIFGLQSILPSIQKEIGEHGFSKKDIDMSQYLTCSQLETLGKIDDAEDFLVKGPGLNEKGIQVKIAVPLLSDFLRTTDNFIKNKSVNAQFRFTHAEAIAPFAAIMGIKGASEQISQIDGFEKVWDASKIIPLSANIQWILYKKPHSRKYLIRFLLNEREVFINGLRSRNAPYYKWKKVKKFYERKIKQMGSSINENGYLFLQKVE